MNGFSAVDGKITSYQPAIESLKRVVALQERQLASYKSKHDPMKTQMKTQMEVLAAKYDAVKVIKEAKVTSGGEDFEDSIGYMQG